MTWPKLRNPREETKRVQLDESGVLLVDKPKGLTSMDVIRVVRRISGARKIGHGGTLDPFATGVLPILLNQATRLSAEVMAGVKEYEGVFYLGVAYDTQDMTGTPLFEEREVPDTLTVEEMNRVAEAFRGEIKQVPPMYSAVKRHGRPLYDYARSGESLSVPPRPVFVETFEIIEKIDVRRFYFKVRCAKGTYVRTLVHDLGEKLGYGAVTESLTRTQTGRFHLDEAVQLSTLKYVSDIRSHLKSLTELVKR